jgi:FKBP-type peptidyl-prolyl cis-trans isomerase
LSRLSVAALVLGVLFTAGCAGDVANTTSETQPATSTSQGSQSPPASKCNAQGIDSAVTDKGAADRFDEGAGVAGSTTPDGLKIVDLQQGTGASVQRGQCVTVQYTGWLTDGTKFDSSRDRVGGFQFTVGAGNVIPGWDKGIPGMKMGGRRRLEVPPALGYGPTGQGPIPANATLVFIVELVRIVG